MFCFLCLLFFQDTTGVQVLKGGTTSSFCVLLTSDGDTHAMIGDMAANEHITVEWVRQLTVLF